MDNTMDDRVWRKKLAFRASRRGFREMDLLMGAFADMYIKEMSEAELAQFERLLAAPDHDVFSWVTGTSRPPAAFEGPVLKRLIAFRYHRGSAR